MVKKPKRKKRQFKMHEEKLRKQLKISVGILIIVPTLILISVIFYGPELGNLLGNLTRNTQPPVEKEVVVNPPIFTNQKQMTNTNDVTITGLAEPGSTVILYVNGPEVGEVVTSNDGIFTFENVELMDGANNISAKTITTRGHESERANAYKIEVDKEPPEVSIESPEDGETIRNLDERLRVTGTVDKKSTIEVNQSFAIVRPDLSFEFLLGVKEGEVPITVKATDEAGNETTVEITVTYQRRSN